MKVSPAAAAYLTAHVPREEKLKAARGEVPLAAADLAVVLFFLCHDADQGIKQSALLTLKDLPEGVIQSVLDRQDLHPRMIDIFARLYFTNSGIVGKIASHPSVSPQTMTFLKEKGVVHEDQAEPVDLVSEVADDAQVPPDDDEPVDEDDEEFKSKFKQAQVMGVADKIKTAMTGDKEWRTIFLKDPNKMVSGAAIKNPRITDAEVLAVLKSPIQNDEVMRVICANKEWVKNYQIRKALVENTKTPLPNAMRYLGSLSDKDIAAISKSKNVSSVLANQAKRIIASKNKK